MTEQEWLACTDPEKMLTFLWGKADKRKCLLFACACERRLWNQPDCEREKVEVTECFADGKATAADLLSALQDIGIDGVTLESITDMDPLAWARFGSRDSAEFAANVTERGRQENDAGDERAWHAAYAAEQAVQTTLLRDIFGNPFRSASIDPVWLCWNDAIIVRLAQAVYHERILPAGTLDITRLLFLADALEEAGCTDEQILRHLRSGGDHYRGCFVLDALLGKT